MISKIFFVGDVYQFLNRQEVYVMYQCQNTTVVMKMLKVTTLEKDREQTLAVDKKGSHIISRRCVHIIMI